MQIIPAILSHDITEVKTLLSQAEGVVNRVQIDVIDKIFADNLTIFPHDLLDFETKLKLDYHLMVKNPVDWIDNCVEGSADRVIGQIEKMPDQKNFVTQVGRRNLKCGLGVDLDTPVSKLDKNVFKNLDVVLLMSVPAGFDHQEFSLSIFEKIDALRELKTKMGATFKIAIDGGVTPALVDDMLKKNVDEINVGKRVFEPDLKQNLKLLNR